MSPSERQNSGHAAVVSFSPAEKVGWGMKIRFLSESPHRHDNPEIVHGSSSLECSPCRFGFFGIFS
jgi:hypothetical protein